MPFCSDADPLRCVCNFFVVTIETLGKSLEERTPFFTPTWFFYGFSMVKHLVKSEPEALQLFFAAAGPGGCLDLDHLPGRKS